MSAAGRESLGVVVAAHVRPLTQAGLAEQHSSGIAKLLDDVRVAGGHAAKKGPATSRGLHVVLGGDVVLHREGDAVEGPADSATGALSVALGGNGECVGVNLQERTAPTLSALSGASLSNFAGFRAFTSPGNRGHDCYILT